MPEQPSRDIDWSDPWVLGGEFLFDAPGFLQASLEQENVTSYYLFGRDPDDDVSLKEFILRESPTARRKLKAFYESGQHPDRQPDDLERRYLALPDNDERSWFDQRLPSPRSPRPRPAGPLFSEETKERWRRERDDRTRSRAAERGLAVEAIEEERRAAKRKGEQVKARRERTEAKEQGIPVKDLREAKRRQRDRDRAELVERNKRLLGEWEARKAAIKTERIAESPD